MKKINSTKGNYFQTIFSSDKKAVLQLEPICYANINVFRLAISTQLKGGSFLNKGFFQ